MKKKNLVKIATIKYNAYKLRNAHQLPFYLTYLISKLDGSEEIKYIKYLMEMTQHFMRTKGYYKLFPSMEKDSEKIIKNGLLEMGFDVLDIKAEKA